MFRRWQASSVASVVKGNIREVLFEQKCYCSQVPAIIDDNRTDDKSCNQWFILPAFYPTADGCLIGKKLYGHETGSDMTALKWTLKCCPQLPRSLVQKLFRLRQARRKSSDYTEGMRPRRVKATDLMEAGDTILLPKSVDGKCPPATSKNLSFDEKESDFVRGLELYKDAAVIVVNKPPGMPVQGGLGINKSLDELAAKYLRYDYKESPRLVHRLDRDSSGILVMGRTQLSATVLHSIFREKTDGASYDVPGSKRILQKRYWALVIGSPKRQQGFISAPLVKVVVDNGKSDRIMVADNSHNSSAQHAVTEYRVIGSSSHGYTWLELSPLTGRKHQLRVHCAEVLGMPIVGDYKYGWQAHKKIGHSFDSASNPKEVYRMSRIDTCGKGSISDKLFNLHLHCKEMILPDISIALKHHGDMKDLDTSGLHNIRLDAPLPTHMLRSWELLSM